MKSNQNKLRAKQKNQEIWICVIDGWYRLVTEKLVQSLKELEEHNLIKFPERHGMMLKVGDVR